MACPTCISNCCIRPCVEELDCIYDCCGCCHIPILLAPNLDLPAGQLLGQLDSTRQYAAFDPTAVDGTQLFRGILKYHVQTDENGHVIGRYFGQLGLGLNCGPLYTNMYVCGMWRTEDLFGDVASAAATGIIKLVDGPASGPGIVRM